MVFMKDEKILIKYLYETKHYTSRKLLNEFPQKSYSKHLICYVNSTHK